MNIFKKIVNFFNPKFKAIWRFLKEIFEDVLVVTLLKMKDFALQVIEEIAKDPSIVRNEDKRDEAYKRIKSKFGGVKDSIINLIIELCVIAIKKKLRG